MSKFSENEFLNELKKAQDFMNEDQFKNALDVLYKLKEIELNGDFDYNLTHKLYQLISNSQSLLNQQQLLSYIEEIAENKESISISELHNYVSSKGILKIDEAILRRELELLILREIIPHKIVGTELKFY